VSPSCPWLLAASPNSSKNIYGFRTLFRVHSSSGRREKNKSFYCLIRLDLFLSSSPSFLSLLCPILEPSDFFHSGRPIPDVQPHPYVLLTFMLLDTHRVLLLLLQLQASAKYTAAALSGEATRERQGPGDGTKSRD
jgi:hypothetical protein